MFYFLSMTKNEIEKKCIICFHTGGFIHYKSSLISLQVIKTHQNKLSLFGTIDFECHVIVIAVKKSYSGIDVLIK